MKLIKAQVTNFRSIEDSEVFEIGDLTCLVGKNEAGKTAILKALHGLSPIDGFKYDKTRDYPRRHINKFGDRHSDGESKTAKTWWELEECDLAEIEKLLGSDVLSSNNIEVTSYIGRNNNIWSIPLDNKKCLDNLIDRHGLTKEDKEPIESCKTTEQALELLAEISDQLTPAQSAFVNVVKGFRNNSAMLAAIDLLSKRKPGFFYTSHFERMSGEVSLHKLTTDKAHDTVSSSDKIFMDFLEYAGTTIEELENASTYEDLVSQCEGASNEITDEIFEYWSQNEALSVKIDMNQGRPEDPHPFDSGTIAKIRIENQNHRVTVPLSERSAGFVWFFSFLSQFKQLKKTTGKAIILLDEPGLTLHGKAQSDLLRYIEERILPEHQVIYTTHSPFMVPAQRLSDVRVVEDVIDYRNPRKPIVKGTKVRADVLSVDKDTLFPLQAHLGYEITQTLFVGKNCILVEGPSDIVYLQVMSEALRKRKRIHLDARWTICPTGGLDKVSSFASLFSGNQLNIVVLCDFGDGDKKKVERLRQSQILKSERILTAADFTGKSESDVEDLFDSALYCELVNASMELEDENKVTPSKSEAAIKSPRLVKQIEALCNVLPAECPSFGHYVPAEWLLRNPSILDEDNESVNKSLDQFEKVFKELNSFID